MLIHAQRSAAADTDRDNPLETPSSHDHNHRVRPCSSSETRRVPRAKNIVRIIHRTIPHLSLHLTIANRRDTAYRDSDRVPETETTAGHSRGCLLDTHPHRPHPDHSKLLRPAYRPIIFLAAL